MSPYAVPGVVAVGTFMSAMGGSLVNVAVPLIRRDFGADMGGASWVLAGAAMLVAAGVAALGALVSAARRVETRAA
jgi:MFS family permease